MPNWVEKNVAGLLICVLCTSLVVQIGEYFSCTNHTCRKHDDEPVKTYPINQNLSGYDSSIGTVSPSAPPDEFS